MHWQNHTDGIGKAANAARNSNAHPDPARIGRRNSGRDPESSAHRRSGRGVRRIDGCYGDVRCPHLETSFEGCRFAIGLRNANNKRFRLACTVGLRVFVCHNLAFRGDYSLVLAKHSKHFSLQDALSIGVDRMQRNFGPMRQQVASWQAQQLSAEAAKLMIYRAFIEGDLEVPRHLAQRVHDIYFNPEHQEFQPRTMWSLSNAFTSAFKESIPSRDSARPRSWEAFLNL
jgi:hypothetical protein